MNRSEMRGNLHMPFQFDPKRVEDTGHQWVGVIAVLGSSFLMGYCLTTVVMMVWRAFQ